MGAAISQRLRQQGFDVAGWDHNADTNRKLAADGLRVGANARSVAADAAIVISSITEDHGVRRIFSGPAGFLEGDVNDKLFIEMSTLQPMTGRELAPLVEAKGARIIEAPVLGTIPQAREGKLLAMVGGRPEDLERARPVLEKLTGRIAYMGPSGAGQTTKLCNQIIVCGNLAVMAEAIKLAKVAGVDAAWLPECLKGGFADSIPLQLFGPRMASGKADPPIGASETMLKDLETACDLAQQTTTALPMTALAAVLFRLLKLHGHAKDDPSTIITLLG